MSDDSDTSPVSNNSTNPSTASSSGTSDTSAPMDIDKGQPTLITLGDGKNVKGRAEALCHHAVSKRSQDNVSCLIIFLSKE